MQSDDKKSLRPHEILDGIGIDRICEMIADDMSYRDIAAKIGVSKSAVGRWIGAEPGHLVRAREALKESAQVCDAKALETLKSLPAEPSTGQVAKAREIAQHYRWRAKSRDPASFGDKVEVSGEIAVNHRDPLSLESFHKMCYLLGQAQQRYLIGSGGDPAAEVVTIEVAGDVQEGEQA